MPGSSRSSALGFVDADAFLIAELADVRVEQQRGLLHLPDRQRHGFHAQLVRDGETIGLTGRKIDQLGQLGLGYGKQRLGSFELADQVEQRLLIAQ